jgi:cell division protease FtsH
VEKERKLTAYHEAGHAVVNKFLPTADEVHEISIIPRGMAGGYTMSLPKEDLSYSTKNMMFEEIVSLLGGRVSEKLTLDDISTGASNDIQRATSIAHAMVTRYGMSEKLGPVLYGKDSNEVFLGYDLSTKTGYSEHIAAIIDEEVKRIIDEAYAKAEQILTDNRDKLETVANILLEKEKISGEEFENIFTPKSEETVEETVEETTEE